MCYSITEGKSTKPAIRLQEPNYVSDLHTHILNYKKYT